MAGVIRFGLFIAVLVAGWQALVSGFELPHYILPSPIRVAVAFTSHISLILDHAIVTFSEVILGLVIGAFLGGITAIMLAASPLARAVMRPMMVLSQALPVFALAPILTLWLGYGLVPKVIMAILIIYFPVTSSFFDGLMRTPTGMLDMARVMGAKPLAILLHIRIPAAVPGLASGLRLAAVYAPIGAIIGEWVGASEGLGYLMLLANGRAKIDLMFAALFMLVLMTLTLHFVVDRLAVFTVKKIDPGAAG